MKLLPYDTFEIQTRLKLEEIIASLNAQLEPKRWLRFSRDHRLFEGEVSRDGFKIMRIIHYRNSFLPVIRGTFKQSPTGMSVMIRMGLHPFVIAFMCIWFGGIIIGLFAVGTGLASARIPLSAPLFIPLAMLLFGWIMVSGGFWFEVRKAKPLLLSVLQGQIKSEQIAVLDL